MSSTPSITISQALRYQSQSPANRSTGSSSAAASPMAIPRACEPVPPPLPPPTYIPEISAGQDPGWRWGNDPNGADFGRPASVKPGSSLLGGAAKGFRQSKENDSNTHRIQDSRRGSSISTITLDRDHEMAVDTFVHSDEDRSLSRPPSNHELQSEKQLGQRTLQASSETYDKQLLSRIGGPNTPKRQSFSYNSGGPNENEQVGPTDLERRHSSLRPLSMPERRHTSVDMTPTSRWPPSSGAVSPGYTGFWTEHGSQDHSSTSRRNGSLAFDDTNSHRGSYDHSMFVNDDFYMEEGQMSNLNIHDRSPGSPKAGSKRRASSPPRDRGDRSSVSSMSGHGEIYHRRSMQQLTNRSSPAARFQPSHSSLSSASSLGPRHGSLGSSLGVSSVPSSATSYGSGRVSPSTLSPSVDPEFRTAAYNGSKALNSSPNLAQHQRTLSESAQSSLRKLSTESAAHSRSGSMSQVQGLFMCECCPKKPKKFDTEEDLRLHESEKQYTCAYCSNRFKNKNEAERHQNSLHLRRHSWSCAALSGIEAAFHQSTSGNGTDVCGYCGEEFSNPPQWDVRAEHVNHIHKFGECNQGKKFFRADHFRQHLKHSHQGTSGKWTNMLENACMKDEPPPEKRVSSVAVAVPTSQVPPALMVSTTGLSGPGQPGAATIEETPHDR